MPHLIHCSWFWLVEGKREKQGGQLEATATSGRKMILAWTRVVMVEMVKSDRILDIFCRLIRCVALEKIRSQRWHRVFGLGNLKNRVEE